MWGAGDWVRGGVFDGGVGEALEFDGGGVEVGEEAVLVLEGVDFGWGGRGVGAGGGGEEEEGERGEWEFLGHEWDCRLGRVDYEREGSSGLDGTGMRRG